MDQLTSRETRYRNPGAPRLPPHPFRGVVGGASGSGKTHWVVEHLVLEKSTPFDRFIWLAPAYSLEQTKIKDLKAAFDGSDAHNFASKVNKKDAKSPAGVAEESGATLTLIAADDISKDSEAAVEVGELLAGNSDAGLQTLVILDDLVLSAKSPLIGALFVGGRHKNASVIELVQQLFAPGTRLHRINCTLFVMYRFGDKREAKMLLCQLFPNKASWSKMLELYNAETLGPHKWLMLDEHAGNSDRAEIRQLRVRANGLSRVFPQYAELL
jgi:hypothetical protein